MTIDGQVLCAFNNSTSVRAPLALALSVNDCKGWEPLAIVEEDPKGRWRGRMHGWCGCLHVWVAGAGREHYLPRLQCTPRFALCTRLVPT